MEIFNTRYGLKFLLALFTLLYISISNVHAAKLVSVGILDKDYLIVNITDGDVIHQDEANKIDVAVRYTPELNTSAAVQTGNWTITSSNDSNYGTTGQNPLNCSRKKKLSGHGEGNEWVNGDWVYEYTYEHWVYLQLPNSLQQGATYELTIGSEVNSDTTTTTFTFDQFNSVSEAIHINLTGYNPQAPHKGADLYYWMGSGGPRSYSSFEGSPVYLYNVNDQTSSQVGIVQFWKSSGPDVHNYNLTGSDVWNIDFSSASTPGTYRLVVEGVGCSQDFELVDESYHDPFAVSVLGYFYMRIGEENPNNIYPPPRTPLYIPGQDPVNTIVYLTTMTPFHDDWESLTDGDKWDKPEAWVPYIKTTTPNTNPNAWGGHSDAADWDRHLGHVINIWDILLPYIMSNGVLDDDDLGITESNNGIPDIIDEARNEVDFWLRLRDGDGYSHGLTNPNDDNEFFQAGPTALAAWANAANAAMLADAFRIAGATSLMNQYRDAAITAYNHASGLSDQQLDEWIGFDEGHVRGRDLKMFTAAFLYNVTGITSYEDVINAESSCADGPSTIQYYWNDNEFLNQLYAVAAYLVTPQPVHYQALYDNMKTQIINEAKSSEADLMNTRPSRRATYNQPSYWRTAHFMGRTIVAHAVTDSQADKDYFRKAMALEAGYGLGRNPLNMIEMTTATSSLEDKRSVPESYTSGMRDGVPGVHPGHTPYMNLTNWWDGMTMAMPSRLYENSFPGNVPDTWPIGETYFPSRYVFSHTEFTPRQTMKGKVALYGYLYSLADIAGAANPTLNVSIDNVASANGTVISAPVGINCGSDCSQSFTSGISVTLTATPDSGSVFIGWSDGCFGTEQTCQIDMNINQMVTAKFEPVGHTYEISVTLDGNGYGSVASTPTGINCSSGTCSADFLSGSTVTLTPVAESGSTFTGWEGACSGIGHCEFSMGTAKSVTATFRSNISPVLYIYDDALDPAWQSLSWTGDFDFAATSPVHDGANSVNATLGGWGGLSMGARSASGNIDTYGYNGISFWIHGGNGTKELAVHTEGDDGESNSITVIAVANTWTEVILYLEDLGNPGSISRMDIFNNSSSGMSMFTVDEIRMVPMDMVGPQKPLTITVETVGGSNGSVTSTPAGIDCGSECYGLFDNDTQVTLTATPDSGSVFINWEGNCDNTINTCQVILDKNRYVSANFEPVGYTWELSVSRDGYGTVTSVPAGISCGSNCSYDFASQSSITITAVADSDSVFTGWEDACSGNGSCEVSMTTDSSVTATFKSKNSPQIVIYDDSLSSGWQDLSWDSTVDLVSTSPVHSGTYSIKITATSWAGFSPYFTSGSIDTYGYNGFTFWVHGDSSSDKVLKFYLQDGGASTGNSVEIIAFTNTWTEYNITFKTLGNPESFDRFTFQNWSDGEITFSVDDIRVVPSVIVTLPGDVNNNGSANLADAISALKVLSNSSTIAVKDADINGDSKIGLEEAIFILKSSQIQPPPTCDAVQNPSSETFDVNDAPYTETVNGQSVSTPWGYDKLENAGRLYPIVVNGCWGEGGYFTENIRKEYPAFYMEYQKCSSDSEGSALAVIIDAAVSQGLRLDENRIYLTGYSKGGSGSYKLVRGFLSGGKLFAGIIRLAGGSESVLPDEAVEKTSIWYHIGLNDSSSRVLVAQDAYDYVKNHALNSSAVESTKTDTFTGHNRTTWTLTKGNAEIMQYSRYVGMGHVTGPPYSDPELFDWLFVQSLLCRE